MSIHPEASTCFVLEKLPIIRLDPFSKVASLVQRSFIHREGFQCPICKWIRNIAWSWSKNSGRIKHVTCWTYKYSTNSLHESILFVYPLLWLLSCQHQYTSHESQLHRSCSTTSACLRCCPMPHSGRIIQSFCEIPHSDGKTIIIAIFHWGVTESSQLAAGSTGTVSPFVYAHITPHFAPL